MRAAAAGGLLALLVLPMACDAGHSRTTHVEADPESVQGLEPYWHAAVLPDPAGPPGRTALRDAVSCADTWTAVGGVVLAEPGETRDARPAVWRSADGVTWTAVEVRATTYWGRRAILTSVACSHGHVVAVGSRSGGAHGNPRVTTFFEKEGGFVDQLAATNLYGGASATNVGPVTGGGPGWLITGNRISGPAVWHSGDGRGFTIEEDMPGLADDDTLRSLAQSAVWDGAQWVVVGGGSSRSSLDREPIAWTSADGLSWRREALPGSGDYDDVERVVATDDGLVALGLSGDRFGVWRRDDDSWEQGHAFGVLPEEAVKSPFVSSLVTGQRGLWATTSDGAAYNLWHSEDGEQWGEVLPPAVPPLTAGEHILTVSAAGDEILLLADGGAGGRLWWSTE